MNQAAADFTTDHGAAAANSAKDLAQHRCIDLLDCANNHLLRWRLHNGYTSRTVYRIHATTLELIHQIAYYNKTGNTFLCYEKHPSLYSS